MVAASCGAATPASSPTAAQAATGTPAPAAKAAYTITLDGDRSGPFAAAGTADQNGFQTYIASLNAAGGVNGHKIDIVVADDRSDVPTALANYQQAISSSSLAFLEQNGSAVFAAIAAKAQTDGIAVSSPGGFNGGVGVYPYVYNTGPTVPTFLDEIGQFAAAQVPNAKDTKAAFIAYDSALTQTYEGPLTKVLNAKGFTLAYSQRVPVATIDMSVAAGNIAATSPAIVVGALQDGAQVVSLVTGLRAHGYSGPIINFNSNVSSASMKKLNDNKMYLVQYTADPGNSSNPDVATMLKQADTYKFTDGTSQYFFIAGYVLAKVVAAAIGKCGDTCTRSSFNAALEQTSVSGGQLIAGNVGFSKDSHVMVQKLIVVQWDNTNGYLAPIKGFGFSG